MATTTAGLTVGGGLVGAEVGSAYFHPEAEQWSKDRERLREQLRVLSVPKPQKDTPENGEKRRTLVSIRRELEEMAKNVLDAVKEFPQMVKVQGELAYLQMLLLKYDAAYAAFFVGCAAATFLIVRHPVRLMIQGDALYKKDKKTEDAVNSNADRQDAADQKIAGLNKKVLAQDAQIEALLAALATKAETSDGVSREEYEKLVEKINQFGELVIAGLRAREKQLVSAEKPAALPTDSIPVEPTPDKEPQ